MKKTGILLAVILFLLAGNSTLAAQISSSPATGSTHFDMTGFPQWTRDLRRAEIIAFGSFPFMFFFTNLGVDTYRFASNAWDMRYAPWPLKPAGAVDQTHEQKVLTLGIAAGGSILIALIDFGIVMLKRNRAERESRNLPAGTPIIIRKPLDEEAEEGNP